MRATNSRFSRGKILVEAEVLRHVADARLDLRGFSADVVTEAVAAAFVGREQAAQHADGGGLAGAVGAEKAVDGAALDLHRQVMHHLAAAERLRQPVDLDGNLRRCRCSVRLWLGHGAGSKVTLTG